MIMADFNKEMQSYREWPDGEFHKWQMDEIRKGFEHGLTEDQIAVFAKPEFSELQMNAIRWGFQHGLTSEQVAFYADPEFDEWQMHKMRRGIKGGLSPEQVTGRDAGRIPERVMQAIDPKGSIVLETFGNDALLFRPGAVQHYVVAHGYDAQTGEWGHGSYYSDPASAYEAANPEIIENATIRWEREDVREKLEEYGCAASDRNIAQVLINTETGFKNVAVYMHENGIAAGMADLDETVSRLLEHGALEPSEPESAAKLRENELHKEVFGFGFLEEKPKAEEPYSLSSETKAASAAKDELGGGTPEIGARSTSER